MKNPYEVGGILFTVAILAGILGGFALNNSTDFVEKGSGGTDTFEIRHIMMMCIKCKEIARKTHTTCRIFTTV